jgi:hypothetical protein
METSSSGAAGAGAEEVHSRRRRGRLDAELAVIGNLLENLWRFSE